MSFNFYIIVATSDVFVQFTWRFMYMSQKLTNTTLDITGLTTFNLLHWLSDAPILVISLILVTLNFRQSLDSLEGNIRQNANLFLNTGKHLNSDKLANQEPRTELNRSRSLKTDKKAAKIQRNILDIWTVLQ